MKTVLIVDDSTDNLYLLEVILRKKGFEVAMAVNGAEALESAHKQLPDLIISDILMPVMDGFMLCQKWKADEQLKHIPFVFYTATYTGTKDEQFALSLGADRFIIKPQSAEVLVHMLADFLEENHTERPLPQKPLDEEMEFFRQHNEILFSKLEKKMRDLEIANQNLKLMEEKYRELADALPQTVVEFDEKGNFTYINRAGFEIFGYTRKDFDNVLNVSQMLMPEDRDRARKNIQKILCGEKESGNEYTATRKDGSKFPITAYMNVITRENKPAGLRGIVIDITERKKMEEQSIKLTHDLNERIKELNLLYSVSTLMQQKNIVMENLFQEIVNKIPSAYQYPEITCALMRVYDYEFKTSNLKKTPWKQSSSIAMQGKEIGIIEVYYTEDRPQCDEGPFLKEERAILTVVTERLGKVIERIRADKALNESEAKYRSIFENAVEGIFQTTPKGQFLSANPAIARMLGYSSPEDLIGCITDLSHQLYVDPEDRAQYIRLIGEHGKVEGYEVQQYRKDGSIIWVSINARCAYDKHGVLICYEGTIEDITFRKQAEEDLKQTAEKLRKSLAGIIQVVSMTAETRDPYTAGHQRKVSNLARTIAQEMNLPNDTVENIRMAGIIHDIGKISVPAEILSKPGILSNIEMSLIRVHPQSGYDILKSAELPYPIAEVVLQHHERLDGSGYPQGLKGDKILLEAKILAVADVVEAIATHRPYRQALGIDAALEEIEKNKGILYDEKVVEVCLKLFKGKGFIFESTES